MIVGDSWGETESGEGNFPLNGDGKTVSKEEVRYTWVRKKRQSLL